MRIGILGSGRMGGALGRLWAGQGHAVLFGGRDAARTGAAARRAGPDGRSGTLAEAAAFGEVLVHGARHAMPSAMAGGAETLAGKVLIDLNNTPLPEGYAFEPVERSFAEAFQADAPGLRVVKAFNTVPAQVFDHCPDRIREHEVSIFVAADDAAAKVTVMGLAEEIGFRPVDAGPLRNARLLEGFGDMIRYLINVADLGPCTTLSARALPYPAA